MPARFKAMILTVFALLAALPALCLASDPYARVTDTPSGEVVLEMCSRTFAPASGEGPRIHLVSAIHIADEPFYQAMQRQLNGYDTVLFEGVKPAGLDPIDPGLDDDAKVAATRDRLQLLLKVAQMYREKHGGFPADLETLRNSDDKRVASLVGSIMTDGWGNRFRTDLMTSIDNNQQRERISFTSLGADAAEGGEGVNADLTQSAEVSSDDKPGKTPVGIQTQLANALHVKFQLDEMDTTNPSWVNADMDINELQHALSEYGEDSLAILDMLEGDSFSAKVAGFVLGFVQRSPQLSSMMKLVMMDLLEFAETTDMMAQQQPAMDKVIVQGRNQVVIEDLKQTIAEHPEYKDIAIFYGAGHMDGLEDDLLKMGYLPIGDTWAEAMRVNPKDTGLSDLQVKMMRNMIKSSLQQQMGR